MPGAVQRPEKSHGPSYVALPPGESGGTPFPLPLKIFPLFNVTCSAFSASVVLITQTVAPVALFLSFSQQSLVCRLRAEDE